MKLLKIAVLCGVITVSAAFCVAQSSTASPAPSTPIADDWAHISAIPMHSHIHVAADHGGSTCYFIAVDDQNLTCGRRDGSDKDRHVFSRANVKSVKLTRYAVSTLGGAAIGAGAGAIVGVAAFKPGGFLDFSGAFRAITTVLGGIGGAAIGGPTDMFRGPTIYRRVETK